MLVWNNAPLTNWKAANRSVKYCVCVCVCMCVCVRGVRVCVCVCVQGFVPFCWCVIFRILCQNTLCTLHWSGHGYQSFHFVCVCVCVCPQLSLPIPLPSSCSQYFSHPLPTFLALHLSLSLSLSFLFLTPHVSPPLCLCPLWNRNFGCSIFHGPEWLTSRFAIQGKRRQGRNGGVRSSDRQGLSGTPLSTNLSHQRKQSAPACGTGWCWCNDTLQKRMTLDNTKTKG